MFQFVKSRPLITAGIGLAVAFWLFESVLEAYVLGRGEFAGHLFMPDARELLTRLTVGAILILFAFFARANIIGRLRTLERLRESEELNRAILNTVIDGIITIDETATVIRFNPAAEKIFGFTPSEVIGKNVNLLMPEPYHSEHDSYMRSYLTTGQTKVIGIGREVRGRRKDGREFPMDLAVSEMRLDGRRMFTGIARDITDEKELERQREDFYAMVTHDLKSPLTSIMGYTDLIMSKNAADPETVEMAEGIHRGSRKLLDMVEDFLAFSRLQSSGVLPVNVSTVDIPALVEEACLAFAATASEKGIVLDKVVSLNPSVLNIDKRLMERALFNLVQNAVNYTPPGGKVSIRAEHRDTGDGKFVALSVTDTGPGIPADEREKVFEKYYRSPRTAGVRGTGLGLAVVKAASLAHGGRVEVQSVPGQGSTFTIYLPAA